MPKLHKCALVDFRRNIPQPGFPQEFVPLALTSVTQYERTLEGKRTNNFSEKVSVLVRG
jgi:hypothetical protein